MEEEKYVKVKMENPEAGMALKIGGKHSVEQALKIMETFDKCCATIRNETGGMRDEREV